MIDIHCHLLYGVDDGAKTIEESVAMLEAAKEQGISAMILTPHYRHGMFAYPKEEIEEHFRILEPYAQKLGIYLALGTEYSMSCCENKSLRWTIALAVKNRSMKSMTY